MNNLRQALEIIARGNTNADDMIAIAQDALARDEAEMQEARDLMSDALAEMGGE